MTNLDGLITRLKTSDEVLAVVIAAILSVVGTLLLRFIIGRGKVGWGFSHSYTFTLQSTSGGPMLAYTRQVWIQNIGRSIAEEVEVIFSVRPAHFEIWPQRNFAETTNPGGNLVIKFDNLNRREHVTITMFQTVHDLPFVTNVRWKGGVGRQIPMGPQQQFSPYFLNGLRLLCWLGLFSIFYFAIKVIF